MDNQKKYFVVSDFNNGEEEFRMLLTEKEIAERWETIDIGGYPEDMRAFDVCDGQMIEVDVYAMATEYLKGRNEMQKEYEEYCENVREYGFDFQQE